MLLLAIPIYTLEDFGEIGLGHRKIPLRHLKKLLR